MRVMLMSDEYPPGGGGIGVSVQRIAANIRQRGVALAVVTFDRVPAGDVREEHTSYVVEQRDERGTDVFRVGPVPVALATSGGRSASATYRSFAAQCLRLAKRARPNVIHSFGVRNMGYVATIIARQLGVPHIVGARGNDVGRGLYNPSNLAPIQFVFAQAAHVTFVANGLFRLATSVFGTQSGWSVIHNGCEVPSELRPSTVTTEILRRFPPGRPIAGLFGHVREKKGVLEVLRAMQVMPPELRPSVLIVGEHPQEEWYARALEGVGAAAVAAGTVLHQTGRVDRDTVLALMRSCDVVVQASLDDGLPNTLLEAMTLGCSLVTSEIFRDDLGEGVVEYCDPYVSDSVVGALTRLLRDTTRRRMLAVNAQRVAMERFSPAREAEAYVRLYEEASRRPFEESSL
jgi:glycosyltransferase involved in cell wall biosynthesis